MDDTTLPNLSAPRQAVLAAGVRHVALVHPRYLPILTDALAAAGSDPDAASYAWEQALLAQQAALIRFVQGRYAQTATRTLAGFADRGPVPVSATHQLLLPLPPHPAQLSGWEILKRVQGLELWFATPGHWWQAAPVGIRTELAVPQAPEELLLLQVYLTWESPTLPTPATYPKRFLETA